MDRRPMHTSKISSFLVASISAAIQNLLDLRPEWHSIMVSDRVHEFQRRSGTSLTMSEVLKNDVVLLCFQHFRLLTAFTVKISKFQKCQQFPNWNAHVFCNICCVFYGLQKGPKSEKRCFSVYYCRFRYFRSPHTVHRNTRTRIGGEANAFNGTH